MPYNQSGELRYFSFPILEKQEVIHGVFTRHGGFSPTPWESLNFGASVGDDTARVMRNREAALCSMGIDPNSVFDVYQVHSNVVVTTDCPLPHNTVHQKADAILTNTPGVTLMMRFADCVPILLYDPINRVIGIVHAGWKGTVNQIARLAILRMTEIYKTNASDIIAAIGPSIGPDHYSVGEDVIEQVYASFSEKANEFIEVTNGQAHLDLWKANQVILNSTGVEQIEVSEICTYCHNSDWYSHRGDHGKTGRFGVIIRLQP